MPPARLSRTAFTLVMPCRSSIARGEAPGCDPSAVMAIRTTRASRIIVLTSPVFDSPEGFPANVRLVGTPLEDIAPRPFSVDVVHARRTHHSSS